MCVNATPSWTKVGVGTVGRCKGTLEAIKSADLLVCLHTPLFTRWLKEARDAGTRVLMVIDAPDELEDLMSPPGLKEAVLHADQRLKRAKTMRITRAGGTDLTVQLGEYPVMSQYGFAETAGRFDHWGAGTCTPSPTRAAPPAPSSSTPATWSSCPTAATCRTMPPVASELDETQPCTHNPLGAKGCGEA